jgi:hypothetical protein
MIHAKGNATMKKMTLFLCMLVVISLACDVLVNISPTNDVPTATETLVLTDPPTTTPEVFISLTQAIPATAVPSVTPLVQPSPVAKTSVTFGRLSLDIPQSVASGASGRDYPPVTNEDAPYWEKTPGHLQVSLNDYYALQGKFHQPQIYVYPAMPYVELSTAAFESMHRLRNVMNPGASITARPTSDGSVLQRRAGLCIEHSSGLLPEWERRALPDRIRPKCRAHQQP